MKDRSWWGGALGALLVASASAAQEPAAWGADLTFHTFSIVAVDPATGESGVVVTTRNPCVGNAVPWVRAGVGAVATQGGTRVEYGPDVLDLIAQGLSAPDALDRVVAADADRLIEALNAGHLLGGDGRHGETQSAAVLVADPRPGMSRRPDQVTVDINVCEHPDPLAEMRRIYDTISETLGFRTLEQPIGRDVLQLKIMLNALGFFREGQEIGADLPDTNLYTQETVEAVNRFRSAQGWQTTVPGFVDARTVARLWSRLEEAGQAEAVRARLVEVLRVNR
jgi:uncharacterized Ntn-hydrolase superfamily protein